MIRRASARAVATFDFSPSSLRVGEAVSFTDQSTGAPTGWMWDFGDGASSNEQNPTQVFTADGSFTVSLTASNANGSDISSATVTVLPEDQPELSSDPTTVLRR